MSNRTGVDGMDPGGALLAWGLLVAFMLAAPRLPPLLVWGTLGLAMVALATELWRRERLRQRWWLEASLRPGAGSRLWLQGRWLAALRVLCLAPLYAGLLLMALVSPEAVSWVVLWWLGAALLWAMRWGLQRLLRSQLQPLALAWIGLRWRVHLVTAVLWLLALAWGLGQGWTRIGVEAGFGHWLAAGWGPAPHYQTPELMQLYRFQRLLLELQHWGVEQVWGHAPAWVGSFLRWGTAALLLAGSVLVLRAGVLWLSLGARLVSEGRAAVTAHSSRGPVMALAGWLLMLPLLPQLEDWRQALAPTPPVVVTLGGHSYALTRDQAQRLAAETRMLLEQLERDWPQQWQQAMEPVLVPVLAAAHGQVPRVADWYYSLPAEYWRLGQTLLGWFSDTSGAERVAAELSGRLFDGLAPDQVGALLVPVLAHLREQQGARLQHHWQQRLRQWAVPDAPTHGVVLHLELDEVLALGGGQDQAALSRRFRQATLTTTAVTGGLLARQWAARQAGRAVVAGGARTAAGSAAGAGAALCAPGGVTAFLCAGVGWVAGWVATDLVLLKVEDWRHRQDLEQALHDLIDLHGQRWQAHWTQAGVQLTRADLERWQRASGERFSLLEREGP